MATFTTGLCQAIQSYVNDYAGSPAYELSPAGMLDALRSPTNEQSAAFDVEFAATRNGKKRTVQVIGTQRTSAAGVSESKLQVCDSSTEKAPWEDEFELDLEAYVEGRISTENMRLICEGNGTWISRELASNFDALAVNIDKQLIAASAGLAGGYAGSYRGVASVAVTAGGSSYSSAPTVTFSAPQIAGGVRATGTATVVSNAVTAITITNAGTGYTSAPTITFTGGGGSGAAATATLGVLDSTDDDVRRTYQLLEANAALNYDGWSDMEMMLEDNGFGSRPLIVGQTNALMHKATKALGISCCNQDGYDMGQVDGVNFYKSRNVTAGLGSANYVMAFQPGYMKAVFDPLNVGEFRLDSELYKEMTIADPVRGIVYDFVLNYEKCPETGDTYWQYTIGTRFGIYALPADKIFATTDYMYNANKVVEFEVSQAS